MNLVIKYLSHIKNAEDIRINLLGLYVRLLITLENNSRSTSHLMWRLLKGTPLTSK